MDSANQIQSLVDQVEKNPEYKISKQEAKGFLSEIKRLTQENKTNMPPLVVIIMAYINMLFPELDELRAEAKAQKWHNFVNPDYVKSEDTITPSHSCMFVLSRISFDITTSQWVLKQIFLSLQSLLIPI